jgi:HEAT repeat protein
MPTRWGALGLAAVLLAASAGGLLARPTERYPDLSGLDADGLVLALHAPLLGAHPVPWIALLELGEAAVPALVRGLSAEDEETREDCAALLAELGPCAAAAVPGIMARLEAETGWDRARLIVALEEIDPGRRDFLKLRLANADSFRRAWSYYVSPTGDEPDPASLVALLDDDTPEIRRRAAIVLGFGGDGRAAVLAEIAVALRGDNKDDREGGYRAVAALGSAAHELAPLVVGALEEDPWQSFAALEALAAVGAPEEAVVPIFLEILRTAGDSRSDEEGVAARALAGYPSTAPVVVPLLVDALFSERREHHAGRSFKSEAQEWAAEALGMYGPLAAEAIPQLMVAARVLPVDRAALDALVSMGDVGETALVGLSRGEDSWHRQLALITLARVHPGDGRWLAALAAEFADPIACARIVALECRGPGDAGLLPLLEPGLASPRANDRLHFSLAIIAAGGDATPLHPVLLRLLGNPDCVLSAAEALLSTGGPSERAVRKLRAELNGTDRDRLVRTLETIARCGRAAGELRPDVESLLRYRSRAVRAAARKALAAIAAPD